MSIAAEIIARCRAQGATIATAESCTGGLISAALTDISGASAVFTHGFIPYANTAKMELLGVPEMLLAQHGAVSEAVARAMAEGARSKACTTYSIAVTGIAGPSGGSAEKPVGLVHMAAASPSGTLHAQEVFSGDRAAIRAQATKRALALLFAQLTANR
jgi:nicotinamide-nucleotide amidase